MRVIPAAVLQEHPSESAIITEALDEHRKRFVAEIEVCKPERIVTLGNAALAVVLELLPRMAGAELRRLSAAEDTARRRFCGQEAAL